jgi:hydrogenase expression/formation protein HypC
MCLGIPGQIVELLDPVHGIVTADVGGVHRTVNVQLLQDGPERVDVGDWVLIHVGFAMSKIDEAEAAATYEFLESLTQRPVGPADPGQPGTA